MPRKVPEQQGRAAVAQAAQNARVQIIADGAYKPRGYHRQIQKGFGPGVCLYLHQQQDGLHQPQGDGCDGITDPCSLIA